MSNSKPKKAKKKRVRAISKEIWASVEAEYITGAEAVDIVKKFSQFGVNDRNLHQHIVRCGLSAKRALINEYALTKTVLQVAEKLSEQIIEVKARYASVWKLKLDELLTDFAKCKTATDRARIVKGIFTCQQGEFECYGISNKQAQLEGKAPTGPVTKVINVQINTFPEAEGW